MKGLTFALLPVLLVATTRAAFAAEKVEAVNISNSSLTSSDTIAPQTPDAALLTPANQSAPQSPKLSLLTDPNPPAEIPSPSLFNLDPSSAVQPGPLGNR